MKIFKRKIVFTSEEQQIIDVVSAMIGHHSCSIEVNPENMQYLINVESLDYFAWVDDLGIELSNHKFFISRRLRSEVLDAVKKIIIEEKSRVWNLKKDTIFKNQVNLLENVKIQIEDGRDTHS